MKLALSGLKPQARLIQLAMPDSVVPDLECRLGLASGGTLSVLGGRGVGQGMH